MGSDATHQTTLVKAAFSNQVLSYGNWILP